MSYLATTDFSEDRTFLDGLERRLKGDLDLSWLDAPRERVRCRPPAYHYSCYCYCRTLPASECPPLRQATFSSVSSDNSSP